MDDAQLLPAWAPRVPQALIRRLYETDAQGIYDEELLDEVGYALLARCQSFIEANEARAGRVRCPRCSAEITRTWKEQEILRCDCGWALPWRDYFATIQHAQLSGAEPVLEQFRAYVAGFPLARTPGERMIAIDRLIHGFHWYLKINSPTRPVAVNLIEGRMRRVIAFLDRLTYSGQSTPGLRENYDQWDQLLAVHPEWYPGRK